MKIEIRYQSRGGNTKAVAESIAKILKLNCEPITVPLKKPVDLLLVGGGVYAWTIDQELRDFLNTLEPNTVRSVAAFSTTGYLNVTGKITDIVKSRGVPVREEALVMRFGARNHALLGGKGNVTLTDKQLQAINNFVATIKA